jgi:hypothetical protein
MAIDIQGHFPFFKRHNVTTVVPQSFSWFSSVTATFFRRKEGKCGVGLDVVTFRPPWARCVPTPSTSTDPGSTPLAVLFSMRTEAGTTLNFFKLGKLIQIGFRALPY